MKKVIIFLLITIFFIASSSAKPIVKLSAFDEMNLPLSDATVDIQRRFWNFNHTDYTWKTYMQLKTGSDGTVTFELPEGYYRIVVSYHSQTKTVFEGRLSDSYYELNVSFAPAEENGDIVVIAIVACVFIGLALSIILPRIMKKEVKK